MGTTPIYGFPYPDPSDLVANYPALGQDLAEDIEAVLPTLGGLAPIATATFTTQASVSVNNCFSATYDNYRIIIKAVAPSGRVALQMRMRLAGTDNTSGVYQSQYVNGESSTISGVRASNQTSGRFGAVDPNPTPISVDIMSPFLVEHTVMASLVGLGASTTGNGVSMESMGHAAATSYDGFTIFPTSGTITGTLRVYGYRN